MARTCAAIVVERFGAPSVLQLSQKTIPLTASPRHVQVAMVAAGVNPSDTYVRLGPEGPWAATPHLLPDLPFTPGKDGAGIVTEAHPDTGFKPGDRVYTTGSLTGALAEVAVCDRAQCFHLPPNVSFAQGACIGVPCATAYRALFQRARVAAGESVLVHGASCAVGLAATQLATASGCLVVGTASSEAGQKAVLAAGAVSVVNHKDEGYIETALKALPSGKPKFDVVLEMAAHANLVADCSVLGPGGRVCVIGSKAQPIGLNPRLTMPAEIDIRGVFLPNTPASELEQIHQGLYRAMAAGDLTPMVGLELELKDAPRAHEEVMAPSTGGAAGNIVLRIRSDECDVGHSKL